MSLQVIGAGLGRTGTQSLAWALDRLGMGPCYTLDTLKQLPTHVDLWWAAANDQAVDWGALFQGFKSTVDWPAVSFLPPIVTAFPAAKVVLTLRDPEVWYESAQATIFEALAMSQRNPNPAGRHRPGIELTRHLVLERTFRGHYQNKARTIEMFEAHNRMVAALVPPAQLLRFQVKDGWEPLCTFLNLPVPDEPFPHTNDRTSFRDSAPSWIKALRRNLN